ncbi:MAG: rhodanese-like domain-containing protein [Gammaproteobacteria bacterium]|nr:rhodanese-like domain-containing protein [Gammaproteobacteria bacterium]
MLFRGLGLYSGGSFFYFRFKLIFCALILCCCELQAGPRPVVPEQISGAKSLTAEQVIELILSQPDLVVIDSRKKTEYIKGHIEGAVNMLNTRMTQAGLEKIVPDKSATILFYCNGARCLRSSDSVSKALSWGYENIFWFRGGWKEWTEKRLPVISE